MDAETDWLMTYVVGGQVITYAGTTYEIVRVIRDGGAAPIVVAREVDHPNAVEQWLPAVILREAIEERITARAEAKELMKLMTLPPRIKIDEGAARVRARWRDARSRSADA